MKATFRVATSATGSGAIAIIDLFGPEVEEVLRAVTGITGEWRANRLRLADLGGVDEGIAVLIGPGRGQIMPHGGRLVVQRLTQVLLRLGVEAAREVDPRAAYPEAESLDEALMLEAMARAQSSLAIDLLAAQPVRWAEHRRNPRENVDELRRRARILHRLIEPPTVVIVGPPNVGKSTLTNALAGRGVSITADEPGTTRDYVGAMLDLGGVTVRWYDTPGARVTGDEIEAQAIERAEQVVREADLVVGAIEGGMTEWPLVTGRAADVRVILKADVKGREKQSGVKSVSLGQAAEAVDVEVSALTGQGLEDLTRLVRDRLVPREMMEHPGPWLFDERLVRGGH